MTNTEAIVMGVIIIGLFAGIIMFGFMDNKKTTKPSPPSETIEVKEDPRPTLKEYIDQQVAEAVQVELAKTHSTDADVQGAGAGAPSQSKTHSGNADLESDPAGTDGDK